MSDGLSQQASQSPAVSGGGGSATPAIIATGSRNSTLNGPTVAMGPVSLGSRNSTLSHAAAATLTAGSRDQSLALASAVGTPVRSTGSLDRALAAAASGSASRPLGSRDSALTVASTITGRGQVTTAATSGAVLWTNPNNAKADDAAVASWAVSDALGAGAATTSSGVLTATNPATGVTPTGWTRSKVEALIHRNDSAVGLAATGDTATLTVVLQDKTGAALQTVLTDTFTAAGSNPDATVAVDVTAAVAAVSDTDLALTKLVATATFARTLAATGTRSWTVNIDSLALRVTYTRTGLA